MNYTKHYNLLIERAKTRQLPKDLYIENHHIQPRCMNGSDDDSNLVKLTAEEHYVAHQLLAKIYPKHRGIIFSAFMMSANNKNHKRHNNKSYGWIKQKLYKTPISNKTRQKMSKSRLGKTHSTEAKRNMSKAQMGHKVSKETRQKISKAAKEKEFWKHTMDVKTRQKIAQAHIGMKRSNKSKQRMSTAAKNRKKLKCPHCDNICDISNAKRWHFDNCKLKL